MNKALQRLAVHTFCLEKISTERFRKSVYKVNDQVATATGSLKNIDVNKFYLILIMLAIRLPELFGENNMHKKTVLFIRRIGIFATLAVITGLEGCVTAPPPLIVAPPPPPAIVYQPAPAYPPSRAIAAPSAPATPVYPAQRQQPARQLSNGQILGILIAANNAEIREAQLTLRSSRNLRVRRFAQQMINSHSQLNHSLQTLSRRLGLLPTQSRASQHLTATAQQAFATLSTLRGRRFDSTYINHQIVTHRTVLNGINTILLPSTRQPYVRGALLQTRAILSGHLQHAQAVLAALR